MDSQAAVAPSSDPLVVGRVIGDVLEDFIPSVQLKVIYREVSRLQIPNSCELKLSEVWFEPTVEVWDTTYSGSTFTLIMTDPDVPTPRNPSNKEYLHWLVTDIPSGLDTFSGGRCVVPYESPKPTMIGSHRFVFSVFRQQHPLELCPPPTRQRFCTRLFAQEFNLDKAVGALFFYSKGPRKYRPRK